MGDFESGNFNGWGSRYTDKDSLLVSGRFYEDAFIGPILIKVKDVGENSLASSLGICVDDFIIEWNDFNYFKNGNKFNDINRLAEEFSSEIESSREKEKRIKVARKENGQYSIREFSCPSALLGVSFTNWILSMEEINEIYEAWISGIDRHHP